MSLLKSLRKDNLTVEIFTVRQDMGLHAGQDASAVIRQAIAEKGTANVMFAAAPSQNETLSTLCADKSIDWNKVVAFHMDEYIGLREDHPSGFRNFLRRALFDHLPFAEVHLLDGNAPDPQAEATRYEKLLEDHPLDICLCGIGENGHIAFNDPSVADFHDPRKVKVVHLDRVCRNQQVNDGCFDRLEDVPEYALTVTVPGMISAKTMICSVPAPTKAVAVRHMLEDPISEQCPATILRTHADAHLYLDADAAQHIL